MQLKLPFKNPSTGLLLLAVYHVLAIIVLLNVIIAMMSRTFEKVSANEEEQWKFNRTSVWVRFIRREITRPPPMNLIPNPKSICSYIDNKMQQSRKSTIQQNELNNFMKKKKINVLYRNSMARDEILRTDAANYHDILFVREALTLVARYRLHKLIKQKR